MRLQRKQVDLNGAPNYRARTGTDSTGQTARNTRHAVGRVQRRSIRSAVVDPAAAPISDSSNPQMVRRGLFKGGAWR